MYFTNYHFTKNVISKLGSKYKESIDINDPKLFLYANTYQLPKFYRLTKFKKTNYDLYEKLTTFRQDLFILNLAKETINNKFYPSNLLFLYSIASSMILYEELKHTNIDEKTLLSYDYQYASLNNIEITKNHLYKDHRNCFLYTFTELDFISTALNNTYYLPQMNNYMSTSLNQFKKCLNKNIITNIYKRIKDIFRNDDIKYKDLVYKKKYISSNPFSIIYDEKEMNFEDFISICEEKALIFLEAINQLLYFNNENDLIKFANDYGWNSITDYHDFVSKSKQDEKNRNKLFSKIKKIKRKEKRDKNS